MRITDQPAYVLHARAWRETSLLLEAFTRDFGRVGLVARGVRGAGSRTPRSLLEPLQRLRLDFGGRGELATLTAVEPEGMSTALRGDALLSAMYVNELLVRLTARNDPHPTVFERYAVLLQELPNTTSLAWSLRCFERDFLAALGYALELERDAGSGAPIDPAHVYAYLTEQGAVADATAEGVKLRGSALLALASGMRPDSEDMLALKRLMRTQIGAHLGGRPLQAWRMLARQSPRTR